MKIDEIQTPALVLHQDALKYNIQVMNDILEGSNMTLYPHYKSHKCPQIAQIQMINGAGGITCAKLSEAVDVAEAGITTIVIANQVVQKEKLPILAQLCEGRHIVVAVDSRENVLALEEAMTGMDAVLHCLIEYEVGMKRCGVETKEEALELAELIMQQPHLEFEGIQAYAGQISHEINGEYRRKEVLRIEQKVKELKEYLEENDIEVKEICGGSTGFAEDKPKDTVYTQFQAGSYLFMDSTYNMLGLKFKQSLFMLTTVISKKQDHIVTDAGVKSFTMDQNPPYYIHFPEAMISFSEEHSSLFVDDAPVKVGDKLYAIPGHCCTNINLFDRIYMIDGTDVVDVLEIRSRGKAE